MTDRSRDEQRRFAFYIMSLSHRLVLALICDDDSDCFDGFASIAAFDSVCDEIERAELMHPGLWREITWQLASRIADDWPIDRTKFLELRATTEKSIEACLAVIAEIDRRQR